MGSPPVAASTPPPPPDTGAVSGRTALGHRLRQLLSGRWVRHLLIAPIRFYQRFISPMTPPACRFHPTCSSYAVEALRVHGAIRGAWLAFWRVMRCHPFHPGGHDPVPPPRRALTDRAAEE